MALLKRELYRQEGPEVTHADRCTLVFDTDAKNLYIEREVVACPRFRRHRVKVFNGAGGRPWRGVGSSHVSSSLRQFG
jgi:hypothetical protein